VQSRASSRTDLPSRPGAVRPSGNGGSAPAQDRFLIECAGFFAEVVQVFGVPKSVGQIYGLLYASPVPLSFSDIVERLEISKGSASQGLQLLRSLGAIKVTGEKARATSNRREAEISALSQSLGNRPPEGDALSAPSGKLAATARRAPGATTFLAVRNAGGAGAPARIAYAPELSLRKLVSGVMQERIAPLAAARADRLAELRELAKADGEARDFYLDRVRQLETWQRRLKAVMPVLAMLLGPKSRK